MNKSIITVHSISFLTDNFHMIYINIFLFELKKIFSMSSLSVYLYIKNSISDIFQKHSDFTINEHSKNKHLFLTK